MCTKTRASDEYDFMQIILHHPLTKCYIQHRIIALFGFSPQNLPQTTAVKCQEVLSKDQNNNTVRDTQLQFPLVTADSAVMSLGSLNTTIYCNLRGIKL